MKIMQKLILPLLIAVTVLIIYIFYFSPKKGLGSFSDFDPNNNANKDIRVKVLVADGIKKDQMNGLSMFYAADKNEMRVLIHAPYDLPPNIEASESVTLKGHLHKEYFHAVEVIVD